MALQHPVDYAQIVDNYIDGWRKLGWMPECRSVSFPILYGGRKLNFMIERTTFQAGLKVDLVATLLWDILLSTIIMKRLLWGLT